MSTLNGWKKTINNKEKEKHFNIVKKILSEVSYLKLVINQQEQGIARNLTSNINLYNTRDIKQINFNKNQ